MREQICVNTREDGYNSEWTGYIAGLEEELAEDHFRGDQNASDQSESSYPKPQQL